MDNIKKIIIEISKSHIYHLENNENVDINNFLNKHKNSIKNTNILKVSFINKNKISN